MERGRFIDRVLICTGSDSLDRPLPSSVGLGGKIAPGGRGCDSRFNNNGRAIMC